MLKIFAWETLLYACGVLWLGFMTGLPILAMFYYGFTDPDTGKSIFLGSQWGEWLPLIFCGFLFLVAMYGMRRLWNTPTFLYVQPDGRWIVRNTFYVSMACIPPEQSRRLVGAFRRSLEDEGPDWHFSGTLTIITDRDLSLTIAHTSYPQKDQTPDVFQALGYPPDFPGSLDPQGECSLPWHTWSSQGPVAPDKTQ